MTIIMAFKTLNIVLSRLPLKSSDALHLIPLSPKESTVWPKVLIINILLRRRPRHCCRRTHGDRSSLFMGPFLFLPSKMELQSLLFSCLSLQERCHQHKLCGLYQEPGNIQVNFWSTQKFLWSEKRLYTGGRKHFINIGMSFYKCPLM